jgi:TonB family protein
MGVSEWWLKMEPLKRAIPKKDLAAGIGTSVLVHVAIFGSALFWALLIPHKPLPVPYCSVDLVSMKNIGMGSAEPKGQRGATGKAVERRAPHHTRVLRRSGPVVPIRRLAVNNTTRNFQTRIKQIEPKDTPSAPVKAQGLESIDRNLHNLVARPKTMPHFGPPPTPHEEHRPLYGNRSSEMAANEPRGDARGGTSTGKARGGRNGTAPNGSAYGSPKGSAAVDQILGMYGQLVREKIERQWSLANNQGVNGLKTVLEVQIKGSGEIVRVLVVGTSGNELFDEAAVRAVNRAGPLPPVPAAAQGSVPQFILTFRPGKVS